MIPHNRPTVGLLEKKYLNDVLKSNFFSQDYQVKKFEEEFANYLKLSSSNVVAVSNGTSAIYLALMVLKSNYNDVYFPAYSCSSLMHATKLANLNPILLDNKKDSHNMDENLIKKKRGIFIFPQMFGYPTSLPKSSKNSVVIEDACQSLGSKIDNEYVGLQGLLGIFSFYATKLITTGGQGGMIVSKNKSLISKIKDFINFDKRKDFKFRFNFQMTEFQAAFGRAQLKNIEKYINIRKKINNIYSKSGFKFINSAEKKIQPVNYRSIFFVKNPKKVISFFRKHGVEVINPIEKSEILGAPSKFPNALNYTDSTISLPCYPSLKKNELDHIVKVLALLKNEI